MKKLLFLIVLLLPLLTTAQDIQHIRSVYQDIAEQIEACTSPEDCSLYKNTLVMNEMGASWRAVGNFSKTISFWYDDDPFNCDDCEDRGAEVLRKVTIEEVSGMAEYYSEYLYENGQLIFYFSRYEEEELRLYFNDEQLIRYMEGQDIKTDSSDQQSLVKSEAKRYQQLFISGF